MSNPLTTRFQTAAIDKPEAPTVKIENGQWVVTVTGRQNWSKVAQLANIPSNAEQKQDGDVMTYRWASHADQMFGKGGVLDKSMTGYEVRTGQLHLARMVQAAVMLQEPLFGEAPTGTGKSFAYLAPLLAMGKKVIVSTSNKALQMQLYGKDLPFLKTLFPNLTYAIAQGKTNYICAEKIAKGIDNPDLAAWLKTTETGSVEELSFDLPNRQDYTLDEECTGKRCKFFDQCYYYRAKEKRKAAQVVICNHALLALHYLYPMANILPATDVIVVDEAHQLPQYVRNALGIQLIAARIDKAIKIAHEERIETGNLNTLHYAFQLEIRRYIGQEGQKQLGVGDAVSFDAGLELASELRKAAKQVWDNTEEPFDQHTARLQRRAERIANVAKEVKAFSSPTEDGHVRWVDLDGPTLNDAPFEVAGFIHNMIEGQAPDEADETYDDGDDDNTPIEGTPTFVFVSATLASPKLESFMAECGTRHGLQLIAQSPFDYKNNSMLYVPPATSPDPGSKEFLPFLAEQMREFVFATKGGAFLLFTSYVNMQYCIDNLRHDFERHFLVLVQGELPKGEIAKRFAADGSAVLFATKSFWEGVDIPGEALRNVLIDKLPFPAPSPLLKARMNAVGDKESFMLIQVPHMITELKQGVGRLIRRADDRGVCAIFDPRLRSKAYGRNLVLPALPPSRQISTIAPVYDFFAPATAPTMPDLTNLTPKGRRPKVEDFTLEI